jgi:hypothetical protein
MVFPVGGEYLDRMSHYQLLIKYFPSLIIYLVC